MKAIQFVAIVPRYVFVMAVGRIHRPASYGPLSCVQYRELPEPRLPGPQWVKVKTRYGGICASDVGMILAKDSPSLSPFGSKRFTIGHENMGTLVEVGEQVEGFSVGDRVVADPVLACAARGMNSPCGSCQEGQFPRCENITEGNLSPGLQIGTCADTGGSWSPYFVAHRSQLFHVPEGVSDENAILVDAFCSALHPVIRNLPRDEDTALIIGAGTISICTLAALRALDSRARVIVLAKYPFQGELARRYGADEVVYWDKGGKYYTAIADLVGGKLFQPLLGKPVMIGGADVTYECVASETSVRDALWLTRAGGTVVQIGLLGPQTERIDWTPLWFKELAMVGTVCSSTEEYQGQRIHCYQLALDFMAQGSVDLTPLLTHTFRLDDYRRALAMNMNKSRHRLVHSAFVFD
jgi:threonine dehydrogenase-like Zn-dependent dehydrogenase